VQPLARILCDEEAVTSVEYAVVLAMILMAVIGAIGTFGSETCGLWGGIQGDLKEVGFAE